MADLQNDQAWELTPFEGVGPLRFGALTREDVIAMLGEPDRLLEREPLLFESYRDAQLQPGYDESRRLIAAVLAGNREYNSIMNAIMEEAFGEPE